MVFVNTVWFVSLVLSLICALLATLLQQWARRYLQVVEQNNQPHIRAHIREYFSRGVSKFVVIGIIDLLPSLFSLSVLLFFAGLVVFAFLSNKTVAYFTLATVGSFSFSYFSLTVMPFLFHECPYYTPLTSMLWSSSQMIELSFWSVLHRVAKQLYLRWGAVNESFVRSLRRRCVIQGRSLSAGMISKLENSAKRISMDFYKNAFVWTLDQLDQDQELEDVVDGTPGLYESEAFVTPDNKDVQSQIRSVLAVLPGPKYFCLPLPWSIIRLAHRPVTNKPSKPKQQRTRTCLRALYFIPGAIRDVLARYAAGKHYFLEILPMLNSPQSSEIIDELWNSPNDDVALSVRCAAAVVAAFVITRPCHTLGAFIGDNEAGKQFLEKRLCVSSNVGRCWISPWRQLASAKHLTLPCRH